MAINISRKPIFGTNNIDKIDFIEFYPPTGRIRYWAFLILGFIIIFVYLYALLIILSEKGKGEVIGIIFMLAFGLAVIICGLKGLSEPSLLIRFFKGDYFLKNGILRKNIIHGNLSELKDIEIDVELMSGDQGGIWVEYWIPILRWKDGKQFILGKFHIESEARAIAAELCNRLKIGYVDKSQGWESAYWENIGRICDSIWNNIGGIIKKILRKP